MGGDYRNNPSPAKFEYLNDGAASYGWPVWTNRTGEINRGFAKRRSLMAANADFKVRSECFDRLDNAAARQPRCGRTTTRYCELTDKGRTALQTSRWEYRLANLSNGP